MVSLEIGMILPSVTVQQHQDLDLPTAACLLEDAGLDGAWHGDHLSVGMSTLDGPVALAAAAAVTRRIRIGVSVFIPAIRPLAWAAKQAASLQHVAQGRLVLGVGSGGGPEQWAAAGVPYAERGRRTDAALEHLPQLLAGRLTRLEHEPGRPEVELAPAVALPPFWIGNASAVAIRRAARLGDGWFPSLVSPSALAAGAVRLGELAAEHGRPVPTIAVGATGVLGTGSALPSRDAIADRISQAYDLPSEQAVTIPITGSAGEAAQRFAEYHAAGARHLIFGPAGGDWRRQCELLAEARALLA